MLECAVVEVYVIAAFYLYCMDEETARKDVAQVLAKWREIGLLA